MPWRCHRNLVADALTARGVRVRHILSATRADEHALHRAARPGPDGTLEYPGDDQLERR